MNRFHIWTIGCQMNKADSAGLAHQLSELGYEEVSMPQQADIIVINSCVVRQHAEDKVANKLANLKALKGKSPHITLVLTGCMVDSHKEQLKERFPHVDFFCRPQQYKELLTYARQQAQPRTQLLTLSDAESPTAFVPIIQGCNNFCSYCIVPYRRGREKSKTVAEIIQHIEELSLHGVSEVTLLGQNVDSYGHDLPGKPDLADLLAEVNRIDGIRRIRFLTSHPKDMSDKLIDAIADLDKVCEHISLPAQAGDDEILARMRRGYTIAEYKNLIQRIRNRVPEVVLSNDIIVGFPGESDDQFKRTYELLEEYEFDTVHVAAYSPRSGTIAWRKMKDDVPDEAKLRRMKLIEELQERISFEHNSAYLGKNVEILVEGSRNGKWFGRTRGDKPVFFEGDNDYLGELVDIRIDHAGPWSLNGTPTITADIR